MAKKIKDSIIIKRIDKISLFPNKKAIAVKIKNHGRAINVVSLRDEAVKNGAEGTLILKYDKKFRFYDSDYKEDLSEIESKLELSKNDLIIVTYADSCKLAEYGAIAAAISVNRHLANIINRIK